MVRCGRVGYGEVGLGMVRNKCQYCGQYEVRGLHIKLIQGTKSPDDKVVLINTSCRGRWLKLSDLSLYTLIYLRMNIEDVLYPPPAKGRHFLGEAIDDLENGCTPTEVYKRYTRRFLSKKPTELDEFI